MAEDAFWAWFYQTWHRVHKTPRTPEDFERECDNAPESPLSAEEIDDIVRRVARKPQS